jgi:hypothetical protein
VIDLAQNLLARLIRTILCLLPPVSVPDRIVCYGGRLTPKSEPVSGPRPSVF